MTSEALQVHIPLTPNDPYRGRTATLTSKRCTLYIYSTNRGTEYFEHGIHSPFLSLQNAVSFIILKYLVPVLLTFYIQYVLKFKKIIPAPNGYEDSYRHSHTTAYIKTSHTNINLNYISRVSCYRAVNIHTFVFVNNTQLVLCTAISSEDQTQNKKVVCGPTAKFLY